MYIYIYHIYIYIYTHISTQTTKITRTRVSSKSFEENKDKLQKTTRRAARRASSQPFRRGIGGFDLLSADLNKIVYTSRCVCVCVILAQGPC